MTYSTGADIRRLHIAQRVSWSDWDKIKRAAGHLDDETERAITDVAIAAVRQFRDETDREETRLKTNVLRNRIRTLVEEARQQEIQFRNLRDRNAAEVPR